MSVSICQPSVINGVLSLKLWLVLCVSPVSGETSLEGLAIEITRLAVILIGAVALGLIAFQFIDIDLMPELAVVESSNDSIDYLSIPWEEYLVGVWEITTTGHEKRQHKFSLPDQFFLLDMEYEPGRALLEAKWRIRESDLETAIIDLEPENSDLNVSSMRLVRTSYSTYQLHYADVLLSTWRRIED